MDHHPNRLAIKGLSLFSSFLLALSLIILLIIAAQKTALHIYAAPIEPPAGYPKFTQSVNTVTPTLANTGGATLHYLIEIRNTGAYTAEGVTLTDPIPQATTYNGDAWASVSPTPVVSDGVLSWNGEVGFDASVIVSYSVQVSTTFSGIIQNSAIISQPLISRSVTVTAETVVTDEPIFKISKTSTPSKPGANKILGYALTVINQGQPAVSTTISVTDQVPPDTTFDSVGPDGSAQGNLVTWKRLVNLDTGDTSVFTFTVLVNDVPSGTVVTNADYSVVGPNGIPTPGEAYTVTILDPILSLAKYVQPDPPGSNREMTYLLTVLNKGSLATDMVITDVVPAGVTYLNGGAFSDGIVSWNLPGLDTDQSTIVTYTVYISDVADVPILNADYSVCTAEGVCQSGNVLTSTVGGPTFQVTAMVDPIAKKPGGGNTPVTPTLNVENLGPGNALDAMAELIFQRISVQSSDLVAIPPVGSFSSGQACGDKCISYIWTGDIGYGETITFTTLGGQNSVGGEEGTHYTATLIITDNLSGFVTEPISATAIGLVTHMANLIPTKTAPAVVGEGQLLTYTINIFDSGMTTDVPPYPWVTDSVPASTMLVSVSDGGVSTTLGSATVVSWTLPSMGPGDLYQRSFTVRVLDDLISGTQIVNQNYGAAWYNIYAGGILSNTGVPVTTTVKELGLIDSFKTVAPTLLRPGMGNILTYTVHVVNSSPTPLTGVQVDDTLPWQNSTYLRDATASAGHIISDIVSIQWTGNVGPYATQLITFSVLVDPDFEGAITNTAVITHTDLHEPVLVQAVAYVTNKPVLKITKTAAPDPATVNQDLLYTINVTNLGWQATELVITDVIPVNTEYVPSSASAGGQLVGNWILWQLPVLKPSARFQLTFRVKVLGGDVIVNDQYGVTCAEGVSAAGAPVYTPVHTFYRKVYLPVIRK